MRYLFSYHYAARRSLDEVAAALDVRDDARLFIDSGAFSALSLGAAINVHDYGEWLAAARYTPAVVACLDVIGNDEASAVATFDNWTTLRDRWGVDTLPVVHLGESLDWLRRYATEGAPYVGLGGLVGRSWDQASSWVGAAHRLARELGVVLHGFGVTRESMMPYPWFSVDSSSWGAGYRYGVIPMWRDGRLIRPRASDLSGGWAIDLARRHGVTVSGLRAYDRASVIACAAVAWRAYEAAHRRRHRPVEHPDPSVPAGPWIYLADATFDIIPVALNTERQGVHP